jgi:hypothetical protein
MLTRRRALAILGSAGIGTGVFQRALAVRAVEGPVTPQTVADAERVAGIKLTAAQREAAARRLNRFRASTSAEREASLLSGGWSRATLFSAELGALLQLSLQASERNADFAPLTV